MTVSRTPIVKSPDHISVCELANDLNSDPLFLLVPLAFSKLSDADAKQKILQLYGPVVPYYEESMKVLSQWHAPQSVRDAKLDVATMLKLVRIWVVNALEVTIPSANST